MRAMGESGEGETGARALDHAMRGTLMPNLAKAILTQMASDEGMAKKLTIGIGHISLARFNNNHICT